MPGTLRRKGSSLPLSLLTSLALHGLLLSLQFGPSGMGLPLFGYFGDDRRADIPMLQAILRQAGEPAPAKEMPVPPATAQVAPRRMAPPLPKAAVRQAQLPRASIPPATTAAALSRQEATLANEPTKAEVKEVVPVASEKPEQPEPPAVADRAPVLDTDRQSPWTISEARVAREKDERAALERLELERAANSEIERRRVEQAEILRKAEQTAARAVEEALAAQRAEERKRVEEEAAKAEQAALVRAREEAAERLRVEEERRKVEQAAVARAREEAVAKRVEAEALARAKEAAALRDRFAEGVPRGDQRIGVAAGSPGRSEGRREGAAGPPSGKAVEAVPAMPSAASQAGSLAARPPGDTQQRRGSILGRDPKDVQLAFYGEGWRQKVERIGSLNYPRMSRNLRYDPLVVTVSINSDGSLAGVRIVKSSGHPELDDAVRRIVEMSAPFAAFPPDLKRSYDVVDITRTWSFVEERARIHAQ